MPILDGDGQPIYTGPVLNPNPASIAFGSISVANPIDNDLIIENVGDDDLIVTGLTSSSARLTFPTAAWPQTLAPGGVLTITCRMNPNALGVISCTATFQSNGVNNPVVVNVTALGVAAGTIACNADPPVWDFPNIKVGNASVEKLITVTNTSTVNVQINAYVFPADFIIGGTNPALPIVLAAGASYQFGVKFQPIAQGYVTETLQIQSTAVATPFLVTLTGMAYLIDSAYSLSNTVAAILYALASDTSAVVVKQSADPIDWSTEETGLVQKLHNFGALAVDKTVKWFWMHYEDLGVCTVSITLSNQITGATETHVRTIGTVAANEARLLDIFEVTMSGEDVLIGFSRTAGSGQLSVLDYGVKYLPFEEQLGTSANPLTLTPVFIASGTEELLFGFSDLSVQEMDPSDFACEASAIAGKAVLLPFPTQYGAAPGQSYEKQLCRVYFHYEYFAAAVVQVRATTLRGQTASQNVTLAAQATNMAMQIGIADLFVTDEICRIDFIPVSGPVSILDFTLRYEIKGERAK